MKKELEQSAIFLTQIIATGKLTETENTKLMAVLGLLQGLLILETVKNPS